MPDMKLVSFRPPGRFSSSRVGALLEDGTVLDLAGAYSCAAVVRGVQPEAAQSVASALIPGDMTRYLETGPLAREAAEAALAWAASQNPDELTDVAWGRTAVRLLAPVPKPPTLRDANTFEGHTRNAAAQLGGQIAPVWYEMPAYYKGTPASIGGPDDALVWPEPTEQLDFEFEYAVVIGKPGKSISPEEALSHVAGYTILNDFSARDIQAREMATLMGPAKGKDFDGGTVIGPCLVTADEVPDPHALEVIGRVNGEIVCRASSAEQYWRWPQIISYMSQSETLLPGDVIGSGTVPDGSRFEHGGPYLRPGDIVEVEVSGLGVLRTQIVRNSTRG
jgi:2-keto-4-pentenoate hydratase/2-oxohepta-3-ene-1,7-dioic acid hydratase in catechol pathway